MGLAITVYILLVVIVSRHELIAEAAQLFLTYSRSDIFGIIGESVEWKIRPDLGDDRSRCIENVCGGTEFEGRLCCMIIRKVLNIKGHDVALLYPL